jgi:hypothetical protein
VRTGIFATSFSNRVNSGASYFGVLDLTGGQNERCVTIGVIEGRRFQGTHGDGKLSNTPPNIGNATNTDWPGISITQPEAGVIGRIGSGYRGGDWNDPIWALRVSNRYIAAEDPFYTDNPRNGMPASGFRCVRTAE